MKQIYISIAIIVNKENQITSGATAFYTEEQAIHQSESYLDFLKINHPELENINHDFHSNRTFEYIDKETKNHFMIRYYPSYIPNAPEEDEEVIEKSLN